MSAYSEYQLDQIWLNTTRPLGVLYRLEHPTDARMDESGNVIYRSRYGQAHLSHSWEVDHRNALALGGPHNTSNLRALACTANRSLGGLLGNFLAELHQQK